MKEDKKWKEEFGEVSEEASFYFTHGGDMFTLGWLLDFIESEKEKSYKEGWVKALEIDGDVKNGREYLQGFSDCYKLYYKELLQTEKADKLKKKMSKLLKEEE